MVDDGTDQENIKTKTIKLDKRGNKEWRGCDNGIDTLVEDYADVVSVKREREKKNLYVEDDNCDRKMNRDVDTR